MPNDRLSSCARPPRLQWRYRLGVSPSFLFFSRLPRETGDTKPFVIYAHFNRCAQKSQPFATVPTRKRYKTGRKPVDIFSGFGIMTEGKVNRFQCRPRPCGAGRRIVNRVRIPSGTATVSAEAAHKTKVGHWAFAREGRARAEEAQVRRPAGTKCSSAPSRMGSGLFTRAEKRLRRPREVAAFLYWEER